MNVILDSNIILRFLTKTVPKQYEEALMLIKEIEDKKKRAYISILVINEIIWLLEKFYKLKREEFIPELLDLLVLSNIEIIEIKKEVLFKILQHFQRTNIDFTDIYLFHIAGAKEIISFDKDFKKMKATS